MELTDELFAQLICYMRDMSDEERVSNFKEIMLLFIKSFQKILPDGYNAAISTFMNTMRLASWNGEGVSETKKQGIKELFSHFGSWESMPEETLFAEPDAQCIREQKLILITLMVRDQNVATVLYEIWLMLSEVGEENPWAIETASRLRSEVNSMSRDDILAFLSEKF